MLCVCVCVHFVVSTQEAISLLHYFSWWFVASGHSRLWLPWWPSEVILDLTLEVAERLWTGHHVLCECLIWFPAVGSLNLLLTTCCFWNYLFIWWFIFKIPTCCKAKGKCSVVKKYNISPQNIARTKIIIIVLYLIALVSAYTTENLINDSVKRSKVYKSGEAWVGNVKRKMLPDLYTSVYQLLCCIGVPWNIMWFHLIGTLSDQRE